MGERRVEYVRLDELTPNPQNPKSHALDVIDASYSRFGVVDNITRDDRTGYIISGHGRRTALEDAYNRGDAAPDGVKVSPVDGMWLVPVNTGWASTSDAQASAALIAINRLTELGGWDDSSLLTLLEQIEEAGDGFAGVGFSETDLDDLRHLLEDVPDLDELADEFDPDATAGSSGATVVIKLTDPGLIDAWHSTRDTFKTDDEAFRSLLSETGLTTEAPVSPAPSRVGAPTVEDLEADAEEGAEPAPDPFTEALVEAMARPLSSESPAEDDGLDWSTASMNVPDSTGGEVDEDELVNLEIEDDLHPVVPDAEDE